MSRKGKCQHVLLMLIGLISPIAASAAQPINYPLNTNWNGFYAGINAGGAWNQNSNINISSSFVPGSQNPIAPVGSTYIGMQSARGATGSASSNAGAFIGGAHIGYNWQLRDRFVTGIIADLQGVASGNNKSYSSTVSPLVGSFDGGSIIFVPGKRFATTMAVSQRVDYLGTIRGQFGWLATPQLLLSATGGFVYGHVSSSASITQTNNDSATSDPLFSLRPQTITSGNYSSTRFGWTIGANAEWMFMPNWSTKLEYLYYDMGSVNYTISPTIITIPVLAAPMASVNSQASVSFNGSIMQLGVSYHFG